ncbi:MAG TPA: histidinol dehydrogenase [Geminicoccaceae bacterium]|nr:histidinol dehydrogenase [Geminicoccus sp.]HMU53064.1 histidinol dehydrogenase [Geminicoccaceae bacterium]
MAQRLDAADEGFVAALNELVERRRDAEDDVRDSVAAIIAAVRAEGDAALVDLTRRFDRLDLAPEDLRIGEAEIGAATAACPPEQLDALRLAAGRIRAFHERQLPEATAWADEQGVRLGLRWTPIDAVGLYVPGGTAAYPSSVLMNAIPARVAGCRRLVMAVPTPDGVLSPLVLAAAGIAGIDEVYRIGGAQAIAALAYGTASIAPVDKIMGPGNAYVAEAKRQVFGRVGIDMIAGPSEIVVVADRDADAAWIAADLLSQAEHDPRAQAILVTDHRPLADAVAREVDRQLQSLVRAETAAASWRDEGAIIVVGSLDDALDIVDRLAPEHLELLAADAESLARRVRHAGAIFLGPHTPEVIGDYVGGPNHVLPTGRSARFASGLAVFDFLKRTTILGCDARSFAGLAPAASILARAEGLEAHALAVERRLAALEPEA